MKPPKSHYREDARDERLEQSGVQSPLDDAADCPCCTYPASWNRPGAKHVGPTVAEAVAAYEERERRRASPGPVPGSGSPTTATLDPPLTR